MVLLKRHVETALLLVRVTKIVVGMLVRGVQPNRLSALLDGAIVISRLREEIAEVVTKLGCLGVIADGGLELYGALLLVVQDQGQAVTRDEIPFVQPERAPERTLRILAAAEPVVGHPHAGVSVVPVGVHLQGAAVLVDRLSVEPLVVVFDRKIDERLRRIEIARDLFRLDYRRRLKRGLGGLRRTRG